MPILKLLGAGLVLFSGASLGRLMNGHLQARLHALDAWIALLKEIRERICAYALPEEEILARVEISMLTRCGYRGSVRPSCPRELLCGCDGNVLTAESVRILSQLASDTGRQQRLRQAELYDEAIGLLSAERDRLIAELPGKQKRNMTLSLAAAMTLAIVLL